MANLKAAITCNHKKAVDPKNPAAKKAIEKFEESVAKRKQEAIELVKADIAAEKMENRNSGKEA